MTLSAEKDRQNLEAHLLAGQREVPSTNSKCLCFALAALQIEPAVSPPNSPDHSCHLCLLCHRPMWNMLKLLEETMMLHSVYCNVDSNHAYSCITDNLQPSTEQNTASMMYAMQPRKKLGDRRWPPWRVPASGLIRQPTDVVLNSPA